MAVRYQPDTFITRSGPLIRRIQSIRLDRSRDALQCDRARHVLDLGCGPGNLLGSLVGQRIVGVDLSEVLAAQAGARISGRAGFAVCRAAAEELPFGSASFDRVVCSEVLEHVLAPVAVIAEIRRVCRPGARVVITIPNEGLINATKRIVIALGIKRWIAGDYPMSDQMLDEWHRSALTVRDILELCRTVGGFRPAGTWDVPCAGLAYHRVLAFDVTDR